MVQELEPILSRTNGPAQRRVAAPGDAALDERHNPLLSLPESELCQRALDSSVDAWNALIQRHNRRVVVALLARCLRIDQAKDIAQETWLRLIEQQRAGKLPTLTLPGLALAQATFIACDAARKTARLRRVEGAPEDE